MVICERRNPKDEKSFFQRNLSSYYFPLLTRVESTFRTTHSDVMCVSNNSGTRSKEKSNEAGASKSCKLPYQELYSSKTKGKSKYESLLQKKQSDEATRKLNRRLHDEHREFVSNLQAERQERFQVETQAAIIIQKYMRGFGVRQKISPEKFARSTKPLSEREIFEVLIDVISKNGLAPCKEMLLGFDPPLEFRDVFTNDK